MIRVSTQVIVVAAMDSKLALGAGSLAGHVGLAFEDYCIRHKLATDSLTAMQIVAELNTLGFEW